jgi:hypothetical protein
VVRSQRAPVAKRAELVVAPEDCHRPSEHVDELGVLGSTVTEAMGIVRDEGLIRFVPGRGVFTAEPDVIADWKKNKKN